MIFNDRTANRLEKATIKQLEQEYAIALKTIREKLGVFYSKYAGASDGMTYADAVKYDRLHKLEKELFAVLTKMGSQKKGVMTQGLTSIVDDTFYRTIYQVERGAKIATTFPILSQERVVKMIQNPISGLTLNDRLAKHKIDIVYAIKQEITQGLVLGEGYKPITDRVKLVLEKDLVKAMRVVQTEANRVLNAARNDAFNTIADAGVNFQKIWVSALDDATRDSHGALDGKPADKNGLFWIGSASAEYPGDFGVAEEDINCRCTTKIEIKGYESTVRRVDGNIQDYITYDEWRAAKDAA